MRRIPILLLLISFATVSQAQFAKNRLDLYVQIGYGNFLGNRVLTEDGFIYPSLFVNYNSLTSATVKGSFNLCNIFSVGAGADVSGCYTWASNKYNNYNYSRLTQYSVYPIIKLQSPFIESGVLNRIKFTAEVSPFVGITGVTLSPMQYPIFGDHTPSMISNNHYGLKGTTAIEVKFNQYVGIVGAFTYQKGFLSSIYYTDKGFENYLVSVGIVFRLRRDKLAI